jgi:hypothetical protein
LLQDSISLYGVTGTWTALEPLCTHSKHGILLKSSKQKIRELSSRMKLYFSKEPMLNLTDLLELYFKQFPEIKIS